MFDRLFVQGLLMMAAGVWFVVRGITGPALKIRRILRFQTHSLGALPVEGPVEVFGRAAGEAQRSPVGGLLCVFWRVEVEEGSRHSVTATSWSAIWQRQSDAAFQIRDDSGEVLVLPAGASVTLMTDLEAEHGGGEDLPRRVREAVERMGVPTTGALGIKRRLRVRERRLRAGDPVYAQGFLDRMDGRPILGSVSGKPLILSDRSKAELLRQFKRDLLTGLAIGGALLLFGALVFSGFLDAPV